MESDRLYRGKTRECWIQRLEEIRKRYQKYRAILEDHLKEQGIILKPAYTDGLDETGRPWGLRIIGKRGIEKMLPLRKDEYALYLFDVGDGVLAFPDNGIGLRYIHAPSDRNFCAPAGGMGSLLAAGSDGKALYILDANDGKLYITESQKACGPLGGFRRRFFRTEEPEEKEKQNHPAGAVEAIDILSLYIKTAEEYFSEKEIQDAVTAFCSSGIVNVEDATYYDPAAKMFFHVYTDGNYYHGYEVRYPRLSPKEVIQSHVRVHFSLNSFIDACQAGKIPLLVILSRLPYQDRPYRPPENFGYGKHFM